MSTRIYSGQAKGHYAVKPWHLLLAATVVSGAVCVVALRDNYAHMVTLRDAVYTADKNDENVTGALQDLQAYVTRHMNTDLAQPNGVYPPIQLKYTYDRLVQAQGEQLAKVSGQNSAVYTDAQHYCEALFPGGYVINKIPCIQNYIDAHGVNTKLNLKPIPDGLYKFDFVSPRWSPDLAGWSLLVTVVLLLLSAGAFVVDRLRRRTKA